MRDPTRTGASVRASATLASLLAALPLGGCSTTIDTSGYERACETPQDCVFAFDGDACSPCALSNTAISKSEQLRYDVSRALALCVRDEPGPLCRLEPKRLVCDEGTCGIVDVEHERRRGAPCGEPSRRRAAAVQSTSRRTHEPSTQPASTGLQ